MTGVGTLSGIVGDPLSHLVRPSQLDQDEQKHLMKLECAMGKSFPDAGRYILTCSQKTAKVSDLPGT